MLIDVLSVQVYAKLRGVSTLEGIIPGIVDAHVNLYNPNPTAWPLRQVGKATAPLLRRMPGPAVNLASRFSIEHTLHGFVGRDVLDRRYELRDYARDLAGLEAVAGVPVSAVLPVDAQWRHRLAAEEVPAEQLREYEYLCGLPYGDDNPALGGVVVAGDIRVPRLGLRPILETADHSMLRGVRLRIGRHPDPLVHDFTISGEGLRSRNVLNTADILIEHGMLLEVLCYSHQIGDVDELARRFPELKIIVNRLGMPVGAFGPVGSSSGTTAAARAEILSEWRDRMAMLSLRPNVSVKVDAIASNALGYGQERSGNIGGRRTLADMIGPLVLFVADRFGADRIVFGSNAPLDRHNATVATVVGALIDVLEDRGDHWLRRFFAENAREIYRIP